MNQISISSPFPDTGRWTLSLLNSFGHLNDKTRFEWCYAIEVCLLY
jgi:hypothetical protein